MKKVIFSLLSVVMLISMMLPAVSPPLMAGGGGAGNQTAGSENVTPLGYIVISPDSAVIKGDGEEEQTFTAEAFDAKGNSLGDVTKDTVFSIDGDDGGSWESNVYTSLYGGGWTVTGTHISGKTDIATLHVIESRAHPEEEAATLTVHSKNTTPPITRCNCYDDGQFEVQLKSGYPINNDNDTQTWCYDVTNLASGTGCHDLSH